MAVIYVKLILDIGHYRGMPRTYLKREIGWPVGLPFPRPGDLIFDLEDDEGTESSAEVQWIEYRPLDPTNQAIIHCKEEIAGMDPDGLSSADFAARYHPRWVPR